MERHVLVVFPHPDDETLAVGGAIALHARAGSPITYACFTLGQMGRNMGKPFFANRETLPIIREKELRDACRILGVSDLRLMGMRDKTLEFEDPVRLINIVSGLIEELNPSLIITYYPGYCVHPDHEALARATVEAVARLPKEKRPTLHCQAFSNGHEEALGQKDVVLDTTTVWKTVFEAVKAHRTQTSGMVQQIEQVLNQDNPENLDALRRFTQLSMYTYRV